MRVLLYSFFALKIIFQNVFLESILTALLSRTSFNPWGLQKYTSRGSKYFFFLLGGKKKKDKYLLEKAKSNKVLRETTKNKQYLEASFSHITL